MKYFMEWSSSILSIYQVFRNMVGRSESDYVRLLAPQVNVGRSEVGRSRRP